MNADDGVLNHIAKGADPKIKTLGHEYSRETVSTQAPFSLTSEYVFKTVYFPVDRVRSGVSARVTVSLPSNYGTSPEFLAFVRQLSSREFRLAIGNPFVEDIETQAQQESTSFSNVCFESAVGLLLESLDLWRPDTTIREERN